MKKVIRLTESDLTRIVKRVIKENESNSDDTSKLGMSVSGINNYLNDNFTPDGGWDNDKFLEVWNNAEFNFFYVNGELAFVHIIEFDEFDEFDDEGENHILVVGPIVYNKLDEILGKNEWDDKFITWFKDNTSSNVDKFDKDDFKGIFSDYVDPSWVDDEDFKF